MQNEHDKSKLEYFFGDSKAKYVCQQPGNRVVEPAKAKKYAGKGKARKGAKR